MTAAWILENGLLERYTALIAGMPLYTVPPGHAGVKELSLRMDVRDIYGLVVGSIFAMCIGWHLAAVGLWARQRIAVWTRKNIVQSVVFSRLRGSTDYTIAALLCIVIIVSGNIVASCYGIKDRSGLQQRLAELSAINLVPLFLAGRTMALVQNVLGLSVKQYALLHRWLGWVCILQLSCYLVITLSHPGWHIDSVYIAVSGRRTIGNML